MKPISRANLIFAVGAVFYGIVMLIAVFRLLTGIQVLAIFFLGVLLLFLGMVSLYWRRMLADPKLRRARVPIIIGLIVVIVFGVGGWMVFLALSLITRIPFHDLESLWRFAFWSSIIGTLIFLSSFVFAAARNSPAKEASKLDGLGLSEN